MKRPLLHLASVILAGRHCHPLGLLLAGLLLVSFGSRTVSTPWGDPFGVTWRQLRGGVTAQDARFAQI